MPTLALLALALLTFHSATSYEETAARCRYVPGDARWPGTDAWAELNSTVGGRLLATVPLAQPCHEPGYDEQKCAGVRQQWDVVPLHLESPTSVMALPFEQQMCNPFQAPSLPCDLGILPVYAINATSASDIAAGIKFARKNNIRLVIKNTGHDLLGKSVGKGALSIWTHHMTSIEPILNYSSSAHTGAAMKVGAGVLGGAALTAASRLGYRIVAGGCPSVGIAGGYSQGGGHSSLTNTHGLAADNVLEWEVVTADGTHTTATPERNADLYWALSGGGGGTYAVVVSMTMRMHRDDKPTAGAVLTFNASSAASPDAYWAAVDRLLADHAPIADAGAVLWAFFTNFSATASLTAPGLTEEQARRLLQPTTAVLAAQRIAHSLSVDVQRSYFEHYERYYGPLPYGRYQASGFVTSWLLPRTLFAAPPPPPPQPPPLLSSLLLSSPAQLLRNVTSADPTFAGVTMAVGVPAAAPVAANSVHPAWRSASVLVLVGAPATNRNLPNTSATSTAAARLERLTNVVGPPLRALASDGAPYLNEANFAELDLVRQTYGPQLARLRRVKQKYDPDDVFYAFAGVGSDAWASDAMGRLCRST